MSWWYLQKKTSVPESGNVTLTSATKAFNIAGVRCAVAHLGSEAVRQAWEAQPQHLFGVVSPLGVEATRAAWEDGGDWLDALVVHLDRSRRLLVSLLTASLPDVGYVPPEATYLAWLDMRALQLADPPHAAYIDEVEVGSRVAGHIRVALQVGDAAEVTATLVANGAELIAEPVRTPWHSLNSRLRGPAGLQLTIFEELDRLGQG